MTAVRGESSTRDARPRWPALDGLRGVAILLVVGFHTTYFVEPDWSGRWLRGGFIGVDIFFALSGFLITFLLLDAREVHGALSYRTFYGRRALRLAPALSSLLVVHLVFAAVTHRDLELERNGVVSALTWSTNWWQVNGRYVPFEMIQLWSLAIEEQFYLLWPLVLGGVLRFRRHWLLWVAATGVMFSTVIRLYLVQLPGPDLASVYLRTDAHTDGIFLGCLLAAAIHSGWHPPRRITHAVGYVGAATLLVIAMTMKLDSAADYRFGFSAVAFGSCAVIAALLDPTWPLARLLQTRVLRVTGNLSYAMYLWHLMVFTVVADVLAAAPAGVRVACALVGIYAVAAASRVMVERPFLRLRYRSSGP